tara:strand:+ start:136 stop:408 length:273 start_codon:yes stop_codon:yes gene_type:complete
MPTNKAEAIHFMKIVLDWCSPKVARMMMDDLDFYIAETTDNESIKESIKMVREMVYARAEENLEIDREEVEYARKILTDEMNRQRGMSKE